ncbi:conserved Plasmodium protein, unknown function [Plasmodium reichenowi]|uniref:SHSP domain-containing protein n=1 Tax=Plasmodium reichenowi TaxID=5854 RepID=A0A060RW03_PLARE|nr:hypothetical protein PRSY57_1235700 [Plasmodium reichenowi]KYN95471.1 hypothetical protein PRSY57_1235700 [Plasmodium reichenowi]CDO65639.1 conserved Plasmodium protein, unknown function [Plasmodium reichenowi]SOV80800.1 conserved Plasmodium protein, unknown function [Plasmodium reichenowi]
MDIIKDETEEMDMYNPSVSINFKKGILKNSCDTPKDTKLEKLKREYNILTSSYDYNSGNKKERRNIWKEKVKHNIASKNKKKMVKIKKEEKYNELENKKGENLMMYVNDKNNNLNVYIDEKDLFEETPNISSNTLLSYISNIFLRKKNIYEIKKCDFIKEVNTDESLKRNFIPPVDILYDDKKVLFLFFISGNLKNFHVTSNNNYLTISGEKIPYQVQDHTSYFSHEIKKGYFFRTYCFMKTFDKEKIYYEQNNGVIKIYVYICDDNRI